MNTVAELSIDTVAASLFIAKKGKKKRKDPRKKS